MLNLIDEFSRECLAIRVSRKLQSPDVIDVLADQCLPRGVPGHVRSDNGPEFIATAVRHFAEAEGAMRGCDVRLQFGPPIRHSVRVGVLDSGTVLALLVLLAPEAAWKGTVFRCPPVRLTKRSGHEGAKDQRTAERTWADGCVGRLRSVAQSHVVSRISAYETGRAVL